MRLQMEASLKRELQTASKEKETFIKEFSEEDYNYIVNGWQVGYSHLKVRYVGQRKDWQF